MRIVGGSLRGRKLAVPTGQDIRPTTDRVRENLFNILQHAYNDDLQEAHVLDLFAGTGAIGIEALSRGARSVLFVEKGREAQSLLRRNLAALGTNGHAAILQQDATRPRKAGPDSMFSLVFADPPYGKGLGDAALAAFARNGWLEPRALAVVEERAGHLPNNLDGFRLLEKRSFGETEIGFYRYEL